VTVSPDFDAETVNAFEAQRGRLRAMAYRMLGSAAEAEDAVQEAWLRLSRTDAATIDNLPAWLITTTTRICLDRLRQRAARREEPLDAVTARRAAMGTPEEEMALAESVGLAVMVVLDRLAPPERIAFVLHDMFDLPFDEIAAIVDRTPEAARQLASRARRRVRGSEPAGKAAPDHRRRIAEAFLAAAHSGDLAGLIALLDPEVTLRGDAAALRLAGRPEQHGAQAVARMFSGRAKAARLALIDGELGVVVAPAGRLLLVLRLDIRGDHIAGIEALADPAQLAALDLAVPEA
jgi:RNA polymerase sigma-70 factor (ECF subfamily)